MYIYCNANKCTHNTHLPIIPCPGGPWPALKSLMGALKNHEDNCPIGNAGFIVVDPCREALDRTFAILAKCFPRASGCRVEKGLSEWIDDGMTELVGSVFDL